MDIRTRLGNTAALPFPIMLDHLFFALTLFGAFGSGIIGGVFFAFSTFVMRALGRVPPAQGIAGMQAINIAVINPWFLGVFFGTAAACAALGVRSLLWWDRAGAAMVLVAGLLYLVGTIGVTMMCNVPRNNALARVGPGTDAGATLWADYLRTWTFWNHVRTVAAIAAMVLFVLALRATT
jgi:uncharacterized membrane protein